MSKEQKKTKGKNALELHCPEAVGKTYSEARKLIRDNVKPKHRRACLQVAQLSHLTRSKSTKE